MKKVIGLLLAFQLSVPILFSCTNFLIGKKASTDGSTMISYSADSYNLYGELYHWPAKQYNEGEVLRVHEWDTGKYLGEIPQALQTYNVMGNMNELNLLLVKPHLVDAVSYLILMALWITEVLSILLFKELSQHVKPLQL